MNKFSMVSSVGVAVVGAALVSGPALAADMPVKAPYAAPVGWTGCYVDAGGGYGMWNQDHNSETATTLVATSQTVTSGGRGWLGRVGAGCDYQMGSRFVVGTFGDYDFMQLHGTFVDPLSTNLGNENESGAWAAGGRVGYLVTPSLLSYVDAGYTQARFDQINLSTNGVPSVSAGTDIASQTYHGWFMGGGTDIALSGFLPISGLFLRTEYRYSTYQAADVPIVTTATGIATTTSDHVQKQVQTITTGLVWRFNFGGPISTRY